MRFRAQFRSVLCALCAACCLSAAAADWTEALAKMPLATNVTELTESNCIPLLLRSFTSNTVLKAFVIMPGGGDEFCFFHRAKATLTNASPTLLDALSALTNQTLIRVEALPPFLVLRSQTDQLPPLGLVVHEPTAEKLKSDATTISGTCFDRPWDTLHPTIEKRLKITLEPEPGSPDMFHFWRHSMTVYGVTGWEMLQAMALAERSTFTVQKKRVVFACDPRPPR